MAHPWSYRAPTPVDRAWIQDEYVYIAIAGIGPSAERITQIFTYMKSITPHLFRDLDFAIYDETQVQLPIASHTPRTLDTVAILWQAATQRYIVACDEPPTS